MRFGIRELLFILVLLGMLAGAAFQFRDYDRKIAQIESEIVEGREKLQQLEKATRHIDDLGQEIDKLAKAVKMFEAKLPAEREVEVILKEVWQLAARHGLNPSSVRTDQPIEAARYSELPLKMVIVGNFDGFYSFLLDLERLSRITQIPKMELEKLRKEKDGQMKAEFTLSIFFESEDSDDGSDSKST